MTIKSFNIFNSPKPTCDPLKMQQALTIYKCTLYTKCSPFHICYSKQRHPRSERVTDNTASRQLIFLLLLCRNHNTALHSICGFTVRKEENLTFIQSMSLSLPQYVKYRLTKMLKFYTSLHMKYYKNAAAVDTSTLNYNYVLTKMDIGNNGATT